MKFHIVFILLVLALVLSSYITFRLEIMVTSNEQFQGIQIRYGLPLYRFEQIYDYTDPRLNFLEVLVIDRWQKSIGQNACNWKQIKNLLARKHIRLLSGGEKQMYFILRRTLALTVVENFSWKSRVGGKNAMWAALHAGLLWTVKGLGMTYLARISHLKKVQLTVEPDYLSAEFASQIDCILKMRIVHIITITFYLTAWKVRWWMDGITAKSRQQPSY